MSINVPKWHKMAQNGPKWLIQTHRCPSRLVFLSHTFHFVCFIPTLPNTRLSLCPTNVFPTLQTLSSPSPCFAFSFYSKVSLSSSPFATFPIEKEGVLFTKGESAYKFLFLSCKILFLLFGLAQTISDLLFGGR